MSEVKCSYIMRGDTCIILCARENAINSVKKYIDSGGQTPFLVMIYNYDRRAISREFPRYIIQQPNEPDIFENGWVQFTARSSL